MHAFILGQLEFELGLILRSELFHVKWSHILICTEFIQESIILKCSLIFPILDASTYLNQAAGGSEVYVYTEIRFTRNVTDSLTENQQIR